MEQHVDLDPLDAVSEALYKNGDGVITITTSTTEAEDEDECRSKS